MNFFELINQCLLELNCKKQDLFVNMLKSDHEKLKNLINRVNKELCLSENWWFRERKTNMLINADTVEVENTIDGKILSLLVDGVNYTYNSDYKSFYGNMPESNTYSLFNNKILFHKTLYSRSVTVFYLTNKFAVNENNVEKYCMTLGEDVSIIPDAYIEQLIVYGACMRFKAMPNNPKYAHWSGEYLKALRTLRSQGNRTNAENPAIIIK